MNPSMDNLEQLSDSELRHRLLQYGFPNLPVTDTTRKILIKKLRNHLNNEKMRLRRDTKFITRYSSDEDSSDVDAAKKRKGKFSSTASSTSTTNRQRSTIFNSHPDEILPPSIGISRRITTNMSSSLLPPASASSMMRNTVNNYQLPTSSTTETSSTLTYKPMKSSIYIPPPILANETDEDSDYCSQKTYKTNSRPSLKTSPPPPPLLPLKKIYSSAETSWSDQQRYTSLSDRYSSADSSTTQNGRNASNDSSPYLSDFTRRLLNLRGETIRDSIYNRNNENRPRISPSPSSPYYNQSSSLISPDPTEIVHQQAEPKSEHNISPSLAFSNFLNRLDEQYGVKQTLIPCILLSTLVIFFAMVAFMYVTISPDLVNTIDGKTTNYTLCDYSGTQSSEIAITSANNCIEKDSIDGALELLKIIAPELQKRAETNLCIDNTTPYTLSAREAISLVQQKGPIIDVRKTIKNLHNLEYLIEMNPQWKIIHVDADGNALKFDQVIHLRSNQSNSFAVTNPKLPFTCSLYNKLQKFFFYIGTVGVILIIFGLIHFIYRIIINYQQSKKDQVAYFVDEIINTLMKQAATNPERSTIIVNHLRDKLIPLHKRKRSDWAWNEAIKFLETNESRIQFDIGQCNGEEVRLMKWIDTIYPLERNNLSAQYNRSQQIKKWHSPAFDKTNKIAKPPTQCLKIRQMFDKFEANNPNLKQIIQDAILEKVGPQCKIYDIQLDKQTCCVYVRCATVKDAGIVHDEINGWWFDKRLVSIKFLRLERYLNRFPKSLSGPQCLRPSNTHNLSMSQCSRGDYDAMNDEMEDDIDEDEDDN